MPRGGGGARFTSTKGKGSSAAAGGAPKPALALPQNPAQLEAVLAASQSDDNAAIAAATEVLMAFLKVPAALPSLLQQLQHSQIPASRQMAAVLLRKCIVKLYKALKAPAEKEQVKSVLLQQLLDEPQRIVRHSIGALISALAKELVPKGQWDALLPSLLQLCQHPSEGHREVAMMLFTALAENLTKSLQKHFVTLQQIFTRGLSDPALQVRVEALRALSTLVDMLDEDDEEGTHASSFATVIDPLLSIMGAHFHEDDILCAGFEVLDNLAQSPTAVLDPFIPKIAELMSRILMAGPTHEAGTREKAAYLLEDIIKHKVHKLLRPNNLIPALLEVSYALICEPFDEGDDDSTPQRWGIEILDAILLSMHVPKRDVFPPVLAKAGELVQQSANQDARKGGFVILAIMAEGCSNLLVDKLSALLPIACAAMVDGASSSVKVRMAACVVVEQFADHLHPDISQYHELVLPHLMRVLANPAEHDVVKEKCCSALDVFCQHLDEDIGRYLDQIVPALISFVQSPLQNVSRSAMSAIRAVASAAKERFEPYLVQCMTAVGAFLMRTDEESLRQRCNATECIGSMGAAVGKARFCAPFAPEPGQNYYDMSFHLVVKSFELDFFELRESAFMYFAEMCEMMGEGFAPRLPIVMPLLLASLFTDDGVSFEAGKAGFNAGEDDEEDFDEEDEEGAGTDSDDSDADDERKQRVIIRSGALDEKISALNTVTTILPLVRTADFAPYVRAPGGRDVCTALWELSEYPHPYIRSANAQAIRELLLWFHRAYPPPKQWVAGECVPLHPECAEKVLELTKLLLERMDDEDDLQCAAEACDGLGEVLQHYGPVVLQQTLLVGDEDERKEVAAPAHLLWLLLRFLNEKAPSQIPEDDEDEDDEEDAENKEGGEAGPSREIADHDFVLQESVSDLIAILAQVMGAGFEPGFRQMFPVMARFMKEDKQAPTKGMAIGCFAEVTHWMTQTMPPNAKPEQHVLLPYLPQLIAYCKQALADPSPLVRRNGAYCTGCIARIPVPVVLAEYPALLQLLAQAYHATSAPVDPVSGIVNGSLRDEEFLGARDNACSAIAKMITTAPQACGQPMSQLIPLVLTPLPLQVDFNEAKSVYPALMSLYRTHSAEVTPHTGRVVEIFAQVFGNPDVDTALQRDIIAFCKALLQQAPQQMEQVYAKLTPKDQTAFKRFVIDA